MLCDQLGVTREEAMQEIHLSRGPYVRFVWLENLVEKLVKKKTNVTLHGERAARAFLLRLVGMTIFSNKTNNRVEVAYLHCFQDLKKVGEYAWGAATLAFLYEHLKGSRRNHCSTMVWYMTFLHVCLFEAF